MVWIICSLSKTTLPGPTEEGSWSIAWKCDVLNQVASGLTCTVKAVVSDNPVSHEEGLGWSSGFGIGPGHRKDPAAGNQLMHKAHELWLDSL